MLRTALRPRWVALLVLVLVAATGMSLLGQWQLGRARQQNEQAQRRAEAEQARRPPAPLGSLLKARETFPAPQAGRSVTATGRWDSARQLLVPGRPLDGRDGFWVLTPLVLDDGSAVPVVRGWVPRADDPAARPPASTPGLGTTAGSTTAGSTTAGSTTAGSTTAGSTTAGSTADGTQSPADAAAGRVTVTGALRPADAPADRAPGQGFGVPAGQLPNVSVVDLLDLWPYPLYTGYLLQAGQQPPAGTALTPARLPPPDPGLAWKNLSYALQWWLFAAFGLFFWGRMVRDDHRDRVGRPATTNPTQAPAYAPAGRVGEDDRP